MTGETGGINISGRSKIALPAGKIFDHGGHQGSFRILRPHAGRKVNFIGRRNLELPEWF